LTWCPGHPKAKDNGTVPTHMLAAEARIGRDLLDGEVVHHLHEDRSHNEPENLCVMSRSMHATIHSRLGHIATGLIHAGYLSIVLQHIPQAKMREVIQRIDHEKEACMVS
jgi:hypothetical protein